MRGKSIIAALHDALMASLSFVLALYLRLGSDAFQEQTAPYLLPGTLIFTLICSTIFIVSKQYKGMWRYASLRDLIGIARGVTLASLLFVLALFLLTRLEGYPRSALFINWMLLIALLGGPRIAYRLLRDKSFGFDVAQLTDHRVPVLLVGTTATAESFIRQSLQKDRIPYRVVGLVEDSKEHTGRTLHGVRLYGPFASLPWVVEKLGRRDLRPHKIILTDPAIQGTTLKTIVDQAQNAGLSLSRLPPAARLEGSEAPPTLAPVAIEDLLGRPQLTLDLSAVRRFVEGRRVLITGAGGTIGGEITRQIAGFNPAALILLDHAEFNLYQIDQEISTLSPHTLRLPVLGDVRDQHYIQHLFQQHRPEIIFHAAAIKHVPLAESNPHEAILTNIIGTRNVADAARECDAEAMVMISTDKAVHPTSVMGATKRAAELYCQMTGETSEKKNKTRIMTVRFGNVLGSTGSVVPLFRKQMERGGPLTVTHPDMVRYFMTVREAVSLVLQASAAQTARGGEIFVLDMGEPVKILDLAEQMIRLSGRLPHQDIAIQYIGLRPGEKLFEELFYPEEAPRDTAIPGLWLATPKQTNLKPFLRTLDGIEKAATKRDSLRCLTLLGDLVSEYRKT